MFAAVVIAEVVSAMSRQRSVKLIYGILGSPGANIFHLYFKGVLPPVSQEGTPAPTTPQAPPSPAPLGFTSSSVAPPQSGAL